MDNTATIENTKKMEEIIKRLDEEIEQKEPNGILVHSDLFCALREKGRITKELFFARKCPEITFTHDMLDKKVSVTVDDQACIGALYHLPQSKIIEELPR